MRSQQLTKKPHWQHFNQPEKPHNISSSGYGSYTGSSQTYTPKNTRDYNFFNSHANTNNNINRHSSQEEFKFRAAEMQKSPVSGSSINMNNQESVKKTEIEDKMKLKSYINSTSSTQYSSTFFGEIPGQDSNNQKSPKNARGNQVKINHSPTFGGGIPSGRKEQPILQQRGAVSSNSNKKLMFKLPQNPYSEVQKNTYAFLHKASSKVSQTYQGQSKPKRYSDGDLIIDSRANRQFKIIRKLGQGKFGRAYVAKDLQSGFILAIKIVQKKNIANDSLQTQFVREIKIQAYLQHPNIIRLYGFFDDPDNLYVLMQLGCHGQLYQIIQANKILSQESTSFITKSLLDAVRCMHSQRILHRDIKPENIVFVHGNVKICDFGWAVHQRDQLRSTFCGTPLYLSPEILSGQKYDEKVDLWAIGILACELRMGCIPFDIKDKDDLYKIVTDEITYPKHIRCISKEYKQFIESILTKNPKERLTSSELLNLPFIRKYEQLETCEQLCGDQNSH